MTAHDDLRAQGWTLTSDAELGLPGLHKVIHPAVFVPEVLVPRPDAGGPVPDRYRIKDMAHYRWEDGSVVLREVTEDRYARVDDRPGVPRFRFFAVPGARDLAAALLGLIPPEMRHGSGTFGTHAFRSFNDVVNSPHRDGFEYGITYVIDRIGEGAVSYLYRDGREVLSHQLQPGEILLFRDADFLHGATPLEGEPRRRDALIMQMDAPEDHKAAELEAASGH